MGKMVHAVTSFPPPACFGPSEAKIGLIGYGSTSGPIREAQELLAARGIPTLTFRRERSSPSRRTRSARSSKAVDVAYVVEHNYTGQFARLLRETCREHHAKIRSILKYDGYSFRAPEIVAGIREGRSDGRVREADPADLVPGVRRLRRPRGGEEGGGGAQDPGVTTSSSSEGSAARGRSTTSSR